jgi:NADH-quinone oxidoreductase subunit M
MNDFLAAADYDRWVLPALLTIPLLGAIGLWVHGALTRRDVSPEGIRSRLGVARWMALVTFVVLFVVSLGLWWSFDPGDPAWHAPFNAPWIPAWGATLRMGIDGISLVMILLTTLLMPLTVLGSWSSIRRSPHTYYALMLVLTTGMLGVFVALDLLLFYVMWEVMLVPMYFIIGIWGGERRIYASLKFFLYTMLPSLLMLVAIVYLWYRAGQTFDYDAIVRAVPFSPRTAFALFAAFFLAFAVKVPMFPLHTWLPDAHVEAPTAGSVVLAGVMLKMGTYGFLRFALPLFPHVAMTPTVRTICLALAVIGVIYGALVAMVQPDFKKLVAYSSVSHLGMVMLGIFALTVQSVQGALLIMIGHGISTGALFLLIGMIYERRHTRLIADYGGLAKVVPMFSALLVLVALSSIGLPGTNGFVGEFLVLLGSFRTAPIWTTVAATGVIFAAVYLLWALQRILFNPLDKPANAAIPDINGRELGLMLPLVAVIIWMGVYPAPVLRRMEPAAQRLVERVERGAALRNFAASPVPR